MDKIFVFLSVFLLVSLICRPATASIHGWAVGLEVPEGGMILHTENEGITWTKQTSGVPPSEYNVFKDVDFIDSEHGWIVGDAGVGNSIILKTTNGGADWIDQSSDTVRYAQAVDFTDSQNGWIMGGMYIYHTTNGGVDWHTEYSFSASFIGYWKIVAIDSLHAWACADYGKVYRYIDGTWEEAGSTGVSEPLEGIDAVDTLNIWACGWDGSIVHSTDGGETWIDQSWGSACHEACCFPSVNQGWVVGAIPGSDGVVYHTTNGGNSWVLQYPGVYPIWRGVHFLDSLNGWIAGYRGGEAYIYHTSNGGDSWEEQYHTFNENCYSIFLVEEEVGVQESPDHSLTPIRLSIYPNPFSDKVSIVLSAKGKEIITHGTKPLAPCIKIYDATGRLVKQFSRLTPNALRPTFISWHGADDLGRKVPAGIYFIQMNSDKHQSQHKVIFVH